MNRIISAVILFVLTLSSAAYALDDTQENRRQQADRYLQATPLSDMFKDMAEQGARNFPLAQRAMFKALLTKYLDLESLTQSVNEIIIKHFTADELKGLADFYGSPVGKSTMRKFGAYMADAMPIIKAEMIKAHAKATREMQDVNE